MLTGVERIIVGKHLEMSRRVFVSGEADKAYFACLFRFRHGYDYAAFREVSFRVVVVNAFMHLPQVNVIGFKATQRIFKLFHRNLFVALVCADLRHQEYFVASPDESLAHVLFALTLVVLPSVVHEVDAGVSRFLNDAKRFLFVLVLADVRAADADD